MNKFKKLLLYLTNNQATSKDEVKFDIMFWSIATSALITAVLLILFVSERYGWIFVILIFYLEFWDSLRHNRE